MAYICDYFQNYNRDYNYGSELYALKKIYNIFTEICSIDEKLKLIYLTIFTC